MRLRARLLSFFFLLPACASASGTLAPLGPEHPASAQATEVPIQDPSAFLRSQEGIRSSDLDAKVRRLLPDYMTMGQDGMGGMGEMGMAVPRNSIPMVGARGPHDYITMGGMFTVLKVRAGLESYDDPGWYETPPGTLASLADPQELERDGIQADGSHAPMEREGHHGHGG